MREICVKNASAIIFLYSVSHRLSFQSINELKEQYKKSEEEEMPITLMGVNLEQFGGGDEKREISSSEVESFVHSFNSSFSEISNVNEISSFFSSFLRHLFLFFSFFKYEFIYYLIKLYVLIFVKLKF